MGFEERLIITLILVAGTILTLVLFRRSAVSTYVVIWLVFPKQGASVFGFENIPQFAFVELIGAIVLAVIAIRQRQPDSVTFGDFSFDPKLISKSNKLLLLICLMFFTQFLIGSLVVSNNQGIHIDIPSGRLFVSISTEISGLLFFYSCTRLLVTQKEVERILIAFVLITFAMAIEFLAVTYAPQIFGSLRVFSFDLQGLFYSIFMNDFILVGLTASIGSIASLYFLRKNRGSLWVFGFLICSILVLINFKRSVIAADILAIGIYLYFEYYRRWSVGLRMLAVFFTIGMAISFNPTTIATITKSFSNSVTNNYISGRIQNFDNSDSVYSRFGIQLRAIEVMAESFPFGVGNKMLRYYMPGNSPKIFSPENHNVLDGYNKVSSHWGITESHNGYLEQVSSYGILGLILMVVIIHTLLRNLLRGMRYSGQLRVCTGQPQVYWYYLAFLIYFFHIPDFMSRFFSFFS